VSEPFVRVFVINFDGGQMTMDCLHSVLATDWPADRLEIVMVDNGSLDDVAERVRAELPGVRVVEPLANTGFAGGCNLGISAPGSFDHVALVNNDAVVEPGWLRPLVEVLEADPGIGAVSAKMLFAGRFVEVEVEVPDAAPVGADPRTLGVRLVGARIDGRRDDGGISFDEGWFGSEEPHRPTGEEMARWSWRRGRIRVRADDAVPSTLTLHLASIGRRTVRVRSGAGTQEVVVDGGPVIVDVALAGPAVDIVQNVGSALFPGGFGGDRGFMEVDHGQFDAPSDVFAWCGGAVLLRRAYLDDVGLFDERLFLYYEDTDLSWRGLLRGWRYRYVPTSVVRHRHAQSSGVGSPVFTYHTQRNRPLVLAKNAPLPLAARAGLGLVRRALRTTVLELVKRPLTLRMPSRAAVRAEWRVVRGYARLLPSMVRDRRRAAPTVPRTAVVEEWQQPPKVTAA
jgi:GT2 family glycosyltransferase